MAFLCTHDSRLDQTAGEHLFMVKLYENAPSQPPIFLGFFAPPGIAGLG
jgi:hypothetical protein